MGQSFSRLAATLVATLVLVSAAVAGSGVAVAQQAEPESADDAYVTSDGDVVLVYDGDPVDDEVELGVDVPAGLVHGLITVPDAGSENVTGSMAASLTESAMRANGSLDFPRPDALEELTFDLEGAVNEETSSFDTSLSTTFRSGGLSMLLSSASTTGEVRMSADRLQATGEFRVASPMANAGAGQVVDISLTEDDGTYDLAVAQQRRVPAAQAELWESREAVEQRLSQQVTLIASQLGGSASVSLDEYSFQQVEGGDYQLDVAYTATVSNVEGAIERLLVQSLTQRQGLDTATAEALAQNLTAVSINELSMAYDTTGNAVTGSATIDVAGYGDLLQSYFATVSELGMTGEAAQNFERFRALYEAQRTAGVTTTFNWSAEVSNPSSGTTAVNAELHQGTTNWAAYVEELDALGVSMINTSYELHAGTAADRVEVSGRADYHGQRIVTSWVNQLLNTSDLPSESAAVLRAFKDAGFERATLDASWDDDVTTEFGASFANLTVLRDAIANEAPIPAFTSAVATSENGSSATYVRLAGAVGGDASESDVRALDGVGQATSVHLAGDWDREFPAMDTAAASEFVGSNDQNSSTDGTDEPSASGGPGFGVLAALVALVAAALFASRRSRAG